MQSRPFRSLVTFAGTRVESMERVLPVSALDSPEFSTSRMYRSTLLDCVVLEWPSSGIDVRFPVLELAGVPTSVCERCLPMDIGGLDPGPDGDLAMLLLVGERFPPPMMGLGLVGDLSVGDLPGNPPGFDLRRVGDCFRGMNITFALELAERLWAGTSGGSFGSVVLSGRLFTDVVEETSTGLHTFLPVAVCSLPGRLQSSGVRRHAHPATLQCVERLGVKLLLLVFVICCDSRETLGAANGTVARHLFQRRRWPCIVLLLLTLLLAHLADVIDRFVAGQDMPFAVWWGLGDHRGRGWRGAATVGESMMLVMNLLYLRGDLFHCIRWNCVSVLLPFLRRWEWRRGE